MWTILLFLVIGIVARLPVEGILAFGVAGLVLGVVFGDGETKAED